MGDQGTLMLTWYYSIICPAALKLTFKRNEKKQKTQLSQGPAVEKLQPSSPLPWVHAFTPLQKSSQLDGLHCGPRKPFQTQGEQIPEPGCTQRISIISPPPHRMRCFSSMWCSTWHIQWHRLTCFPLKQEISNFALIETAGLVEPTPSHSPSSTQS